MEERRQQRELQRAEHGERDQRIGQDGIASVVDERHAEAEDIQAALEGAQRPAGLALRLLAAPTRGRRLRLER